MRRFPDWEIRLATYWDTLRTRVFEWGDLDCCVFTANSVEAQTGEDKMPEFRGRYHDEGSARDALKRLGKGTLTRTMDAKFQRVPVSHAHRGDIVMVAGNLGIAMGQISVHVGQEGQREGLIRHDRREWQRAWAVPMPGAAHG